MSGMDGLAVLQELKRFDETIPVIMTTRFTSIGRARNAIRLGAYDYITKPFDIPYTKALISEALQHMMLKQGKE